ncbi:hypothetical protein B7494_g1566 [Chlorociboria aeruginascens]|nr:hypothetical protein B7494_g1566 [Chlorociboria aeruginascens]
MGLFVLTETSAGFALFKARDKKVLQHDDIFTEFETAEGVNGLLKLKSFEKFDSAAMALEECAALTDGKVTPMLSKLLDSLKNEKKASLAVLDPKLGQAINKLPGLTLTLVSDASVTDVYRAIREFLPSLIPGLLPETISTMSLGLSHSLSRHKLKFSPDKVDTMIVQAIALLDDLDKELNVYAMRVKEWYGWHFPEMGRIVNDNLAYARVILKVGMRSNTSNTDLTDILPEEIETAIKAAAEVSMGTEITKDDLENIKLLAEQVVGFTEYRQQLSSYLTARMQAIAPNLTELVGELVGARLIAHSGSLMNLAKSPASTIQILGAEKALFRALKTKHDTPKYGLIYHASLVGQATGKNKGKIARMLASKSAIGTRVDALSDWSAGGEGKGDDIDEKVRSALGVISRSKIEHYLRGLEHRVLLPKGVAVGPNGEAVSQPSKWEVKEARKYNADADGLAGDEPPATTAVSGKKPKKEKKSKPEPKKLIEEVPDNSESEAEEESEDEDVEMTDINAGLGQPTPLEGSQGKNGIKSSNGFHSDTLSTVSEDTPEPPAASNENENWQSSILGNTIEAKKARKKERHERRLASVVDRSKARKERKEKEERRAEREQRRQRKAAQYERRGNGEKPEENTIANLAAAVGLSIEKYKRKVENGQIRLNADGTPIYISKKELKKQKKGEAASTNSPIMSKKRKLEDDVENPTLAPSQPRLEFTTSEISQPTNIDHKMADTRSRSKSPSPVRDAPSRRRSRSPRRENSERTRDRRNRPRRNEGGGSFRWKEKRRSNDEDAGGEKRLERGYRKRSRSPRREKKNDTFTSASVEDKFGVAEKFGSAKKTVSRDEKEDTSKPPERAAAESTTQVSHGEPMIIVHVNDRLGTKAAIPCLASDPIKLFKAQVAMRIGRQPHEILLKRQGERPFKDQLTLEDYGLPQKSFLKPHFHLHAINNFMLATQPHLRTRRPSPTTVEYTVCTSPQLTLPLRLLLLTTTLLRIVIGTTTFLLLYSKFQLSKYAFLPPTPDNPSLFSFIHRFIERLHTSPFGKLTQRISASIPSPLLIPLYLLLLYTIFLRLHTEESLLVLRGLGIQTSTSSSTYLSTATTRFIPTEKIQDVFINEAFRGFEVRGKEKEKEKEKVLS